jgi:hypothetical protein
MEAQIESMRGNLMALKNKPAKEKKEKAPVASSSKGAASCAPKAAPATNGNKRKTTKKPVAENDALSIRKNGYCIYGYKYLIVIHNGPL